MIKMIIHHDDMHAHTHARTCIHISFYSSLDFVRDNPGETVTEETFTDTQSHLSWSSVIPYLLPPSITIWSPCTSSGMEME